MATEQQLKGLTSWLEWAGAKIIAMPSDRIKPATVRAYWPDISQDKFQVLEFRETLLLRALAPSADEITLMDEILYLPSLLSCHKRRRVLQLRALVHPITLRHLKTWKDIAKAEHKSPYFMKTLHTKALRELWARTLDSKLDYIGSRFESIVAGF